MKNSQGTSPGRLGSLLDLLVKVMAFMAIVCLVFLMLLIVCDILARNIFNSPIRGVPEIARESIVAIVFLSLPFSLANDRWIKSDLLVRPIVQHAPGFAMYMMAFFHSLSSLIMGIIAFESLRLLMISVQIGDYVGAQGIFTFPVWPVKTIIVMGSLLTAVVFARKAIDCISHARRGGLGQ